MANSYTGVFQQLAAAFNEVSLATEHKNAFLGAVTTDISPEPGMFGATVNTNIAASTGTAVNLQAGNQLTLSDVTLNPGAVTLNQHPSYGFPLYGVDLARGLSDTQVRVLRDEAIKIIANAMNAYVASLATAANFNVNAPIVSGTADDIPDATIAKAWKTLAQNNVPVTDLGNMFLVTTPAVYSNVLQRPTWTQQAYVGPISSEIRQSARLNYQYSAFIDWDNDMAASKAIYFHKSAIALASRAVPPTREGGIPTSYVFYKGIPIRLVISYDNRYLADVLTVDSLFGASVIKPTHGVMINASTT